ncbi:helix-turn-helix domain-containing protein [Salinimicrobium xinjiangense]|uniref:helix-turn-helix domain-containing protein n=1 Tax=Salinimicrobium xinjiangense TaxID=438596 RepID=UPI000408311D|nr:helix-turn-helix transcriptional regulator [Salinimicrobium xinjiangense]
MKQPELGQRIAELRKEKGLTQEELVDLCNISVRTIQRIETGEVTPRTYTVKTILSALGHDLKDIRKEEPSTWNKKGILRLGWIFGIVYLLLGFLEGPMDFMRISEDLSGTSNYFFFPVDGYSQTFYLIIKVLVLVAFIFFLRGFVALGTIIENSLLKISALLLIALMIFTIAHDITSLFWNPVDPLFIAMGISVAFGVLGIIFGISLIRLRKTLGPIWLFAGLLEIAAGLFFLFVNPLGLPIQMLAGLLQVIILYKAISPRQRPAAQLA